MRTTRSKVYLITTLVIIVGTIAAIFATNKHPRLGLDLEGGTSVILTAQSETEISSDVLQQAVDIIRQRIDALGVSEPEVTSAPPDNILVQLPGVEDESQALKLIGTTAQLTFRRVEQILPPDAKNPPAVTGSSDSSVNDESVVYPSDQPDEPEGTLYKLGPAELTGEIVTKAEAVIDPQSNSWSVSIDMNDEGSKKWGELTSDLACKRDEGETVTSQIAIVLDGKVESSAGMKAPDVECGTGISGGQTSIDVGEEQASKDLALVLKYGSLPITLEQSQIQKISPTLGRDSLQAGIRAGAIGLILVIIYMLLYYRALGFVALAGLILFTAAIYSTMALLGETSGLSLSLAGVAGIIVSIGITTDSYIVAFERLKDEVRAGKTLRAAVDRGMVRSFKTILVADFVTGSAAVILFVLAVGPVKGFALTLGLATLIDVLIAYFFTRPAVQLLARTRAFTGNSFFGMRRALGVEPT